MTTTLKLVNRPLTLGTVTDLPFTHVSRDGSVDLPGARGEGMQILGKAAMQISLSGSLSGVTRFEDFKQFERTRMLGRSLKLNSDELDTVAFLEAAKIVNRNWVNHVDYSLSLKESLFKSIHACDDLTGWSEDESGTVALEDTDPQPREGEYCVTDTLDGDDSHYLYYSPLRVLDLTDYPYVAFDVRISDVAHLTSLLLQVNDDWDGAYGIADLMGLVLAADTWYRVILHKSEFTEYDGGGAPSPGALRWDYTDEFWWKSAFNQNGDYVLAVDDLGAYE